MTSGSLAKGFSTPRLRAEPMVLADAEALFAVLSDLALYRYMAGSPPSSVEELAKTIARRETHNAIAAAEPCLNWALWLRSGLPVGHVQATVSAGSAWVGYALASSHWGLGYATESLEGLVGHLHSALGVSSCLGVVELDNLASVRVLTKVGFRLANEEDRARRALSPTEALYLLDFPPTHSPHAALS